MNTVSTICVITDESNELNKTLSIKILLRVDFIFSALHKFGYGDKFIHIIKVAYINIESEIKIWSLSDPLIVMSVRQGCLLSMLLHNIVAVVLANLINADKRIKGNRRP